MDICHASSEGRKNTGFKIREKKIFSIFFSKILLRIICTKRKQITNEIKVEKLVAI